MPFLETEFGALLLTFGTAMVPVLELRGAIPVGVAAGLSPAEACVTAILGNLVHAGALEESVGQLMLAAVGDKALAAAPREVRDSLRADILKQVLILQV